MSFFIAMESGETDAHRDAWSLRRTRKDEAHDPDEFAENGRHMRSNAGNAGQIRTRCRPEK
jgi:hypothetical protein